MQASKGKGKAGNSQALALATTQPKGKGKGKGKNKGKSNKRKSDDTEAPTPKTEAQLNARAKKTQEEYTMVHGSAQVLVGNLERNPKWKHLKADSNLEDLKSGLAALQEKASATNTPSGDPWSEWLTRPLQHLKREKSKYLYKLMIEALPGAVGTELTALNKTVTIPKQLHASYLQQSKNDE